MTYGKIIFKLKKIRHQNPELGHKQGEILEKNTPRQNTLKFKAGGKLRKSSIFVKN